VTGLAKLNPGERRAKVDKALQDGTRPFHVAKIGQAAHPVFSVSTSKPSEQARAIIDQLGTKKAQRLLEALSQELARVADAANAEGATSSDPGAEQA